MSPRSGYWGNFWIRKREEEERTNHLFRLEMEARQEAHRRAQETAAAAEKPPKPRIKAKTPQQSR